MPWVPTSAGQTLTSAKVEDLASYAVPVTAEKAGDTSRNTTTTATADPDLVVVLPAGRTYDLKILLYVSSAANAAGDLKVNLAWTNTATVVVGTQGLVATLASGSSADLEAPGGAPDTTSPTIDVNLGASTTRTAQLLRASVATGGSAVTVSLMWAQQSSNANNTTLHAGSRIIARRSS